MAEDEPSRRSELKVRLTLGPALIDLEATLEEIVVVVTRLTQEFTKAAIIPAGSGAVLQGLLPPAEKKDAAPGRPGR